MIGLDLIHTEKFFQCVFMVFNFLFIQFPPTYFAAYSSVYMIKSKLHACVLFRGMPCDVSATCTLRMLQNMGYETLSNATTVCVKQQQITVTTPAT